MLYEPLPLLITMEKCAAMEVKAEAALAEKWQSFAFQAPDYSRKDRYTIILAQLVDIDR